jgi:hypothetical protein
MRRLLALCALFALPAAGLACGDDGGGGGGTTDEATDEETISLADWVVDADEICGVNDARVDDIEPPPAPDGDLTDDQLQEIADYLTDVAAIEQETVDSLRALPTPDERADDVTDVLDTVQNAIDDTNEAAAAASGGDQQEAEDLVDAASQQFDDASAQAADLGLQECGQDGGGDNTGDGNTGDTGRTGEAG